MEGRRRRKWRRGGRKRRRRVYRWFGVREERVVVEKVRGIHWGTGKPRTWHIMMPKPGSASGGGGAGGGNHGPGQAGDI